MPVDLHGHSKLEKKTLQSTTNQIFFRHKAENEAINRSQVIFAVNQVKNSEYPADKENLKRKDMNQMFKNCNEKEAVTDFVLPYCDIHLVYNRLSKKKKYKTGTGSMHPVLIGF